MENKSITEILEEMIKIGNEYLSILSKCNVMDLQHICEKIHEENSIMESSELKKAFENDRNFSIEYDKNGIIKEAKLSWSYYDSAAIVINSLGIEYWTKKEYSPKVTVMKMNWSLLKTLLNYV